MTRILALTGVAILALTFTACTSPFYLYKEDLFAGKNLLEQGEFGKARELFVKASTEEKRAPAFAFAAVACYKMGDLASAEGYIYEAARAEGGAYVYLRILGYKALILFKEGKKDEGLASLKAYIDQYRLVYPLMNIESVESMWRKGEVNQEELELLLDEQILNFESEVQQAVTTGTGFYSTRPPPTAGFGPFDVD